MGVSANTLFHFTAKESLLKIIQAKYFFAKYSNEYFENILPQQSPINKVYTPLISFCDLTIMQLAREPLHTKTFGFYGIGLKKEWGVNQKVSPIVYVHGKSQPSLQLTEIIKTINSFPKTGDLKDKIEEIKLELIDSFKFIKPYESYYQKGKKGKKLIEHYNEREWRFCPTSKKGFSVIPSKERFAKQTKSDLNDKLKSETDNYLKFNIDDIKYIVLKTINDISDFIKAIDSMELNSEERDDLIRKIITFKELENDF